MPGMHTLLTLDSYIQGEGSNSKGLIQRNNVGHLNKQDLKRYSRNNKTEKSIVQSNPGQDSYSVPENIDELPLFCDLFNVVDKLIAFKKLIKSCTKYHMSNFVSYDSLFLSSRTFVFFVSFVSIPQDLREDIGNPKWKECMIKEMKALPKNITLTLILL